MHRLNIDKESPEYTEGDQVTAPGMIEVLNRTHNIALVSQEAVPERLKGHTLILYLPERDFIGLEREGLQFGYDWRAGGGVSGTYPSPA